MVELFGTNNKLALNTAIIVAAIVVAGLLGVAGRRRWGIAVAGFLVAGAVGLVAALAQSLTDPFLAVLTVAVAIAAALGTLRVMLRATRPAWAHPVAADPADGSGSLAARETPDWDRRRFLQVSGGVAAGSLVLGLFGRNLLDHRPAGAVEGATLPTASGPQPTVPAGASLDVEGITPIVTPNESFYRIDTALVTPKVDVTDWQLTVKWTRRPRGPAGLRAALPDAAHGTVRDHRLRLERGRRQARRQCPVDGRRPARRARHGRRPAGGDPDRGPLRRRLHGRLPHRLGHGPGAPAHDRPGHERRTAARRPRLPGPSHHPRPLRLRERHQVAERDRAHHVGGVRRLLDAARLGQGGAHPDPVAHRRATQRHDPEPGATVALAGVAWAPDRGVQAVEVAIDDGDWQPAELSMPLNDATWVQWKLPWIATTPGLTRSRSGPRTAPARSRPTCPRHPPPTAPAATTPSPSASPEHRTRPLSGAPSAQPDRSPRPPCGSPRRPRWSHPCRG